MSETTIDRILAFQETPEAQEAKRQFVRHLDANPQGRLEMFWDAEYPGTEDLLVEKVWLVSDANTGEVLGVVPDDAEATCWDDAVVLIELKVFQTKEML